MPRWNEEDGLWELTEAEQLQSTHKGNVLTPEQARRGGRTKGQAKRRSPEFYSALGRARALKRWANHTKQA